MFKVRMKRACDIPLAAMRPVEGGHHCPDCDKVVYDLRKATRAEARALFERSDATPCVRIVPDAKGYASFRPARAAALGAALFASGAMGCEESPDTRQHPAHPGEVHTDEHTEDFALAGEPVAEFDEHDESGDSAETDSAETDSAETNSAETNSAETNSAETAPSD